MDENSSERYAALYDTREPLMECVLAIDGELAELKNEASRAIFGSPNIKKLYEAIIKTAKDIYKTDEAYQKTANIYMSGLRTNIKNIKKGKAANTAYFTEVFNDGGTIFDKKN
jgi:hypothetical protein